MSVTLHYGEGTLELEIPERNIARIIRPHKERSGPGNAEVVREAFSPSKDKVTALAAGKNVCILVGDGSRDMPMDSSGVLVNQAAAFAYMIGSATWGAYPGNEIDDIQSGVGVACNTLMFEGPQKSVVRGPFSLPLDPLSLHSRTVHDTCRKMNDVHSQPSLRSLSNVLWSAMRS